MSDPDDEKQSAAVEREIREQRKFTPEEALARLAGPGAMKCASPISPVQEAEVQLGLLLRNELNDAGGALRTVLHRHLRGSMLLLENLKRPRIALVRHCENVLASPYLLKELVREADVEWGLTMDERPYFQTDASPAHPADPYTVESVRAELRKVVERLDDCSDPAQVSP